MVRVVPARLGTPPEGRQPAIEGPHLHRHRSLTRRSARSVAWRSGLGSGQSGRSPPLRSGAGNEQRGSSQRLLSPGQESIAMNGRDEGRLGGAGLGCLCGGARCLPGGGGKSMGAVVGHAAALVAAIHGGVGGGVCRVAGGFGDATVRGGLAPRLAGGGLWLGGGTARGASPVRANSGECSRSMGGATTQGLRWIVAWGGVPGVGGVGGMESGGMVGGLELGDGGRPAVRGVEVDAGRGHVDDDDGVAAGMFGGGGLGGGGRSRIGDGGGAVGATLDGEARDGGAGVGGVWVGVGDVAAAGAGDTAGALVCVGVGGAGVRVVRGVVSMRPRGCEGDEARCFPAVGGSWHGRGG